VLPLAYRAKRILVVGDPNQLTPVVTLTKSALAAVAASAGTTHAVMHQQALSAGQDSAYTAFAARCPSAPQLLEEHYRCHPQIARFFNEQFYAGALRILTDVSSQVGDVRGLSLVNVPGHTRRGETGARATPKRPTPW
jgi:superfamily I DNA and/or RNA helicase